MTKNVKRFFSLVLALSMLFGLALPAAATETDVHVHSAVKSEDVFKKLDVEVSVDEDALEAGKVEFDFDYTNLLLMGDEEVEVDTENPAIIAIESELNSIKVLNAEGESVPLTEEQKQNILYMYQQYLDNWTANANLLGVQTPFFLSYNDSEDELGILGEMLVLANWSLEDVRAGKYTYDDITGMIQNFLYADALGVNLYGQAIKEARDEVLNLINNSGAQTDVQKFMVINNWLAQNVTFDMPYIMNTDKEPGEEPMVAPNPQQHEYYDVVYDTIYKDYEENIRVTFEQKIRDGLQAEFMLRYYNAAIEQGYYQAVYAEVEAQVRDAIYQQAYEAAYEAAYQAAYDAYLEENMHHHQYVDAVTTPATCTEAGVKTYTCSDCGDSYTEEIPATGHSYVDEVTPPTCGAEGYTTHTCSACEDKVVDTFVAATGEHTDADNNAVCDDCGSDDMDHEHDYESKVINDATCTEAGKKTYTCPCGATYDEDIAAKGHSYEAVVTAPTCTEEGYTTHTCSACGDNYVNSRVDATDHKYEKEVTAPTCVDEGYTTYTCSVCGDTFDSDKVPATGEHKYVDGKCECGAEEPVVPHEHSYEERVTTEATCGTDGVKTSTCECGDIQTEVIPATGDHKYVNGKCECGAEEPAASCEHTYEENKNGMCDLCGEPHVDHVPEDFDPDYCRICYAKIPSNGEIELPDDDLSGNTVNADDVDEELAAAADAYAKAQAEAAATEQANAAVEAQAETITSQATSIATEETQAFLTENAEAIAADPVAFVEGAFGADAAAQIAAGWEEFWADAQTNGVEVDPENAPGYKMTVDQIVTQQMDTPQQDPMLTKLDANGNPVLDADGNVTYMTPNEAIPVFADQAAVGLTQGVLDYWQGSHFGALGRGTAVCLGYTKAFTYLVQCMKSDIYTNGRGIDTASNWKTAQDLYYDANGNLDISKNYTVDCVRISFDTDVTMYGETQENFNSDHFWNAVKVDGKWYYVDPCYVDVYTEVMNRDRVETDGSNNYMYFMFSHTTTTSLYEGYYSDIKTLYADAATHTNYEDSWLSRVKSNLYFNGGYAYYLYDSTDLITLLEESNSAENMEDIDMNNSVFKVVRHKLTTTDAGTNGDSDYEALIEFNYKANEDDEESVARVKDASGNMVESELLTKLYAQHEEDRAKYPSLALSAVFYRNKVYFNLSNVILSYDINTCEVVIVKEYNTVSASRDKTNAFGGMAFSVVSNGGDFTIQNHPITGLSLKDDGKLYVSIATNFAFISGKDPHNSADQGSYGYEFEESNYNQNYNSYTNEKMGQYEGMGYEKEINDNDEFMWSANFVETLTMSHFAGTDHSYAEVSVEASCGHNAYTEERCTTCGVSKVDSRVEVADTAREHHYIRFDETYYTKTNDNWNTGFCYICPECLYSIEEPTEPDPDADYESSGTTYEEQLAIYEEEKAIYDAAVESAGHDYVVTDATWAADNSTVTFSKLECESVCPERKNILDCLMNDNSIAVTLKSAITDDTVMTTSGVCTEGLVEIYTATGGAEINGTVVPYEVSKEVVLEPTACNYVDGVCTKCGDCTVKRIAGADRVATALAVATELKAVLGVEKFEAIIIAAGGTGSDNNKFADALSGSYLASIKKAPILLYTKGDLAEANLEFIQENLSEAGTIYLLGGNASVPAEVEEALKTAGYNVKRLGGADRYETNRIILNEAGMTGTKEILISSGLNFADSLSASATGLPIMLVKGTATELDEKQIEFLNGLKGAKVTILGGTAAVSAELEAAIEAVVGADVERIFGSKREETSSMIAEKYFADAEFALVAYSKKYPDGLGGGVLANALGAPLLLTNAGNEEYAQGYIEENGIESGYILGGTAVITDETAKIIFGLADDAVIKQK